MKTRHALMLYIFGLCLDIIGALFKVLHYEGPDQMLTLGAFFKVSGGLIFFTNFGQIQK